MTTIEHQILFSKTYTHYLFGKCIPQRKELLEKALDAFLDESFISREQYSYDDKKVRNFAIKLAEIDNAKLNTY